VNSDEPLIALDSVSKRYGSKEIIHDISFDVKRGEIVGFLGPNGAGKTTTMKMISGFTAATSGTVKVAGFDMAQDNLEGARRLGYLPEHPPLYEVLDVTSYLKFVAKVKRIPNHKMRSEIDRVISSCQLEAVTTREIFKLSKGYRQRVGLAQALIGDPDVLLLDEPTAGLDPGQIQETREVIRSFSENHAVLLSTHILPEVTLICKRIAIINQGRVLAVDSPAALQAASEQTSNVSADVSGSIDDIKREIELIDGVNNTRAIPVSGQSQHYKIECQVEARDDIEADIAKAVTGAGNLHSLVRQQPSLENVFLKYVSESKSNSEVDK